MERRYYRISTTLKSVVVSGALVAHFAMLIAAGQAYAAPRWGTEPNIHIPAFDLPMSSFVSSKTTDTLEGLRAKHDGYRSACVADSPSRTEDELVRCTFATFYRDESERAKAIFRTLEVSRVIGGVQVIDVEPVDGIPKANKGKILINLGHGTMEASPVAALGGMRVVAINFLDFPPQEVTTRVVAIYKALLRDYKPESIGIYGCSGGRLEELAAIRKERLPTPGAIGALSAPIFSKSRSDDSGNLYNAMVGNKQPTPDSEGAKTIDDLPAEVASAIPPSFLAAGTRDVFLSKLAVAQQQLSRRGKLVQLHVFEGMIHGWLLEPSIQESRDVYEEAAKFFNAQLGRHAQPVSAGR